LWKINVGAGASGVAVCGGRLYTMGNVQNQDVVYALDAETGHEIWRYSYPCKFEGRSFEGGTASTPATDGRFVYTLSHTGLLLALDAATGTKVWEVNLPRDAGGHAGQWGYAGSPLIEGKLLIVDAGGNGSANLALDRATGKIAWKSGSGNAGYSSAVAFTLAGKRLVTIFRASGVVGIDPADGTELWRIAWPTLYECAAATPVVEGDKIFISSGYGPGQDGVIQLDGLHAAVLWRNASLKNHTATSVIWKGCIYGIDGQVNNANAALKCLDLQTGAEKWSYRGLGAGTLILAAGKLLVLGEKGDLAVAPAVPEGFTPTSQAHVIDGHCWIEPVLSHGRLYVKSNQGDLVCLDLRGP
jgi:outer membrane protein assembly factor BamB